MSNSDKLNSIAMGVLSAALFAIGGKTFVDILSREHALEKPGYVLPVSKAEGGSSGGASAEAKFSFAKVIPLLAKANPDSGADVFKKCATCHTNNKGGENKVGPNLWGVIGRPVGKHPGFSYSDAMKSKGGDWTWENIATYLHDPKEAVPGNKMQFLGVPEDNDLADLLVYMRKQADSPVDLPAAK